MIHRSLRPVLFSLVAVVALTSSWAAAQPGSRGSSVRQAPAKVQLDAQGRSVNRRIATAARLRDRGRFMSNEAAVGLQRTDPARHAALQAQARERVNLVRREVGMTALPAMQSAVVTPSAASQAVTSPPPSASPMSSVAQPTSQPANSQSARPAGRARTRGLARDLHRVERIAGTGNFSGARTRLGQAARVWGENHPRIVATRDHIAAQERAAIEANQPGRLRRGVQRVISSLGSWTGPQIRQAISNAIDHAIARLSNVASRIGGISRVLRRTRVETTESLVEARAARVEGNGVRARDIVNGIDTTEAGLAERGRVAVARRLANSAARGEQRTSLGAIRMQLRTLFQTGELREAAQYLLDGDLGGETFDQPSRTNRMRINQIVGELRIKVFNQVDAHIRRNNVEGLRDGLAALELLRDSGRLNLRQLQRVDRLADRATQHLSQLTASDPSAAE